MFRGLVNIWNYFSENVTALRMRDNCWGVTQRRSALPLATEGTQECIWNLSYNERRMAIDLELTKYLEEEDVDMLINQFPVPADYDGVGSKGTKFVFYM